MQKLSKAQKFKLNVMKAFRIDEERPLQKSIWDAMIEDELPEDVEPIARTVEQVTNSIQEAPKAALNAAAPAEPEVSQETSEASPEESQSEQTGDGNGSPRLQGS